MALPRHSALSEWDDAGVEKALVDLQASGFNVDETLHASLTHSVAMQQEQGAPELDSVQLDSFELDSLVPAAAEDPLEQVIACPD